MTTAPIDSPPDTLALRVLYVSGDPASRAHGHLLFLLDAVRHAPKMQCSVTTLQGARDIDMEPFDAVVLARVPWGDGVPELLARCREFGLRVGFAIDDLVFVPSLMTPEICDLMRVLDASGQRAWMAKVEAYEKTFLESDFMLTSTEPLAAKARELGKPAAVLPYCGTPDLVRIADDALDRLGSKPSSIDNRLRIGYASGTPTHQKDFAVVAPALADLLRTRPHLTLTVVGDLALGEFPELLNYGEQIEFRAKVSYEELFLEYARFDINIVPLEYGNPFCECKTALKYYEAALVGVPTVCAATQPFRQAVKQGETGYLVHSPVAWKSTLELLLDNQVDRLRMGEQARSHAIAEVRLQSRSDVMLRAFQSVL